MTREERCFPEQDRLFDAILKLKDREECRSFFEDICTMGELNEMAKRLWVAELLTEGVSYLQISKRTGVSTATISRVNRALSWGAGGYGIALERLDSREKEEEEQA